MTRSTMIDDTVRELAAAGNLALLTTLLPDGYPQTHVVWIDHDDECLLVNTEVHRTKFTNTQRDPKVSVVLVDAADHHRYVELRGDVVDVVRGEAARAHIDELSRKYRGHDYDPAIIRSERAVLRIAPRRRVLVRGRHWTGLDAGPARTPDRLTGG
jgi:PPOX class probable F420-dependent enzyme